ncbi:MAG: metallophosphoesterase [Pirellulales bacterium]|nr:metallophosphoesterase [Pirellulales bacterium]
MTRIIVVLGLLGIVCGGLTTRASSAQHPDSFTVALIPDTQYYCDLTTGGTPQMYYELTGWLADRAEEDNIRFAIHLGDIVQTPYLPSEWQIANIAQNILEWDVPYSVLPGNHDLSEEDYYNEYFGPSRFDGQAYYGGHEGTTNNNNFCYFSAAGMNFLVLSLEYDPSLSTLQWASQVVENHPSHRVIVASHEYLNLGGGRREIGERIWNNLVRNHDNIFMVVSGHISGWAHQTSTNDAGHEVIEILSDYQWEPDGLTHPPLGGDGWLNTMEFVPAEDKIYYKSYSPYLDTWRTTELHEFTLDYAMPDPLPGDTNWDGVVNNQDAQTLARNWLQSVTGGHSAGDFNHDGWVDDLDASILAANWNAGAHENAVPEPTPAILLLCLMLVVSLPWARSLREPSPVA